MDERTEQELEELRVDLEKLKTDLKELLALSKAGAKPVELDEPIGRLSRMDAMQHQQMAVANRQSHQLRYKQVCAALNRFESADYGYCRRCDEAISFGRLKARPESPFCLNCQGASERR